jgi:molybdenum cofactor cytidylyltransferase
MILIASMTAIIDRHDVVPTAITQAGGVVEHFGVPVDPGNLLLVGYCDATPIIGAPGCVRSPKINAFDLVLPRLLAGERITRHDLIRLGHGGLLEEIRERTCCGNQSTKRIGNASFMRWQGVSDRMKNWRPPPAFCDITKI